MDIEIPYQPRPLQEKIHNDLKRFNVICCHRRFGKTVFAINHVSNDTISFSHEVRDWPCEKPDIYVEPMYTNEDDPLKIMKSLRILIDLTNNLTINCTKTSLYHTSWDIRRAAAGPSVLTEVDNTLLDLAPRRLNYGSYIISYTVDLHSTIPVLKVDTMVTTVLLYIQ